MSKTKDLRFASRIEEATPARRNDDFAWSEHHAAFDWELILWIGEGFGTQSAFVSSKEKQVFINSMCQTLPVSREATFQRLSNYDALLSNVYSCPHAAWSLNVNLGELAPSEVWLQCKYDNVAAAKHEKGQFEAQPSSPLTSSEREQLLLLLRKAYHSRHISDENLAHLLDVGFEQNIAHALSFTDRTHSEIHTVDDLLESGHQVEPAAQVTSLEEFQGFVEKIEGDKAYVRLDTIRGERLCGPYPADELTALGIGERDRFLLKAIDVRGAVRFDAVLIPRKKISPEWQRQIREEIEAGLEGFTPDDER